MTDIERRLRQLAELVPAEAEVLLAAADALARIKADNDAFKARIASIDPASLHTIAGLHPS